MSTSLQDLMREYEGVKALNLRLDMTRGKPSPEQLALSAELLDIKEFKAADGADCRNYGGLEGLPEARQLFADYLEATPPEVIVGGNSSLALMHDVIVQAMIRGILGKPWVADGGVPVFLCPVPGYDRHFAICQRYGIKMITVAMDDAGPDMERVEDWVKNPNTVGIWCVPKYSNPTGITYNDEVVRRLASMQTGNPNFRIFWDNAYAVHELATTSESLLNIREECKKVGTENRVLVFGSTSKITFSGAGVSAVAMSKANLDWFKTGLQVQTIGPDKLNQLRHVRFLRDMSGIRAHMLSHRQILAPKFIAANRMLFQRLGNKGIAGWTQPYGGYFISIKVQQGCAKRVVELAGEVGVKLTPAGATYPYGINQMDDNIRIAPSFPSVDEVTMAMDVVALCVEIASYEKRP